MIITIILTILVIVSLLVSVWMEATHDNYMSSVIIFGIFVMFIYWGIPYLYSTTSIDTSNVETRCYNYSNVCYKATGGFFHPYLKVDCNSKSVELTEQECQEYYLFNTITNKTCPYELFNSACGILKNRTIW
jgi:hypothetical protein